ncbi:GSCOCG00000362001-RA-CDS [Cotesia congregata]|nr:GSCOCG00000362001-RA-CDS [Cotesia congregata]
MMQKKTKFKMGKPEAELLTKINSSEKRSLLSRYNIPIEHLSYEYITECNNTKYLERIVLILRSGEEGYYPELIKHAEIKLASIFPQSMVLREPQPIIKQKMLEKDKQEEIDCEMDTWIKQMNLREKDLEDGKNLNNNQDIPQPDIRKIIPKSKSTSDDLGNENKGNINRIKSFDYAAWDKYDADTELNKIDLQEEQRQAKFKKLQHDNEKMAQKFSQDEIVNNLTLSGTELNIMAEREREKGNEAFRAGDYHEALTFYNSSLSIDSSINGYNNRAITYIKLKRFKEAVDDCNMVLEIEPTNIKALLRRAFATENIGDKSQAIKDYEMIIKLEPMNKLAINALKKLLGSSVAKKVRIKIEDEVEEIKSNNYGVNIGEDERFDIMSQMEQKYLERKGICFCNRAPSTSRYTKPLPHRKASYCYESISAKPSFYKYPNISSSASSIFSETSVSSKNSGVFIEEITESPKVNNSEPNLQKVETAQLSSSKSESDINFKHKEIFSHNNEDDMMKFGEIRTPYDFDSAWLSVKNKSLKLRARLLRAVGPRNIGRVISNKLDGPMFSLILKTLETNFTTSKDVELLKEFLEAFSKLNRFSIILLFADKDDQQALENIFKFLEQEQVPDIENLYNTYLLKEQFV